MKEFLKKYKIALAIISYVLLVSLVSFFVARPMINAIRENNIKIQEKIADQESKRDRIANLPETRVQFEMVKEHEDTLNLSLDRDSVVNLIERLEKISEETKNTIKIEIAEDQASKKNVAPAKKAKEEKTIIDALPSDKYMRMVIRLDGTYESFLDFLKRMENMEYYADVISVKVMKSDAVKEKAEVNPFNEEGEKEESASVVTEEKINTSSTIEAVFYLKSE